MEQRPKCLRGEELWQPMPFSEVKRKCDEADCFPEDTRGDGSSRSAAGTKRGRCNSRVPARFPDAVAAACGRWCSLWFWGTSYPRQVEAWETHTHRAAGRYFCTSPKASSCSAQACRIRSRGGHLIGPQHAGAGRCCPWYAGDGHGSLSAKHAVKSGQSAASGVTYACSANCTEDFNLQS